MADQLHVDGKELTEGVDFEYRYVAGLGFRGPDVRFYVVALAETKEPELVRLGQQFVINDMTTEQAEHLWMQLGKALGKREAFEDG